MTGAQSLYAADLARAINTETYLRWVVRWPTGFRKYEVATVAWENLPVEVREGYERRAQRNSNTRSCTRRSAA